LQAAWNKYGEDMFRFVVVVECPDGADLLAEENKWLREHVGQPYCYNIATDASAPMLGMSGERNPMWGRTFTHTEVAKTKIAAASAARVQTMEERAKRRRSMIGHYVAQETRAKISASLSGDKNPNYGKPRSDEFKAKVSKPVLVISPTGEEAVYPSIIALRNALDLKPTTVNRAVKSKRPITRGPYKGWIFKYA
jgi:group I intron endonuclease